MAIFAQSITIANFDDITPSYGVWAGLTEAIATPAENATGNAYMINVPAGNSSGGGCWIACPFTKNQYTKLKFKMMSSIEFSSLVLLEAGDVAKTKTYGGSYDKWIGYNNIGNWQDFEIDLSNIEETARLIILPGAWTSCPNFTLYIDNILLDNEINGVIDNFYEDLITVYPNPTSEFIEIKLTDKNNPACVSIFTIDGKMVYNKTTCNHSETINLKQLNIKGMTIIQIITSEYTVTKKITIL